MASAAPGRKDMNNDKGKDREKGTRPLVPPDERFWQRYSPNHEFPISSASSFLIHLFVLGCLILGARTFANWDRPVDVDALIMGGGGGRPEGEEWPNTGRFGKREDVKDVADSAAPQVKAPQRGENLKDIGKLSKELVKDADDRRFINDDFAMGKKLSALGEQVRNRINALQQGVASKGLGGSGAGGGKGKGQGPGEGGGIGPGRGTIDKRQERQRRWTMIFNIRDPEDYARQLNALGAILAVPSDHGEYLVIEDLTQRPAVAKVKDIKEYNRMFWIDDKPNAVEPLFRVLDVKPVPTYFVAFFPQELERELLKKEVEYRNLPENRIEETRFKIVRSSSGKGYEPVVESQELKP